MFCQSSPDAGEHAARRLAGRLDVAEIADHRVPSIEALEPRAQGGELAGVRQAGSRRINLACFRVNHFGHKAMLLR